ncbi:retinol dehydrogenase 13-like [Microplitis mediator]|uniref:retinol dehydrogenase 13-like n=1 Tax=Microplitis mediator TaxID=375433 RepID=UPI002554AA32|nr:retinol dehydrogenase 13-like [Microplitis mediator]
MGIKIPKSVVFGSAACTIVGGIYLIKDKIAGTAYEGNEKLTNKVVIVTGANTGIGKEVTRDLAKREAKVIMACRDLFKCEKARKEIVLETKNKFVYCRQCNLASQSSIRAFVDKFKKENDRLDILINNAGVMRCPKGVTTDGIETQLGVNHMGHFLLTNLLLDTLKASAPSRIVVVSSAAHRKGKIKTDDFNSENSYDGAEAYAQSKLANVLFTKELAKKLAGTGVTVNAVHPGIVDTEITRHMSYSKSTTATVMVKPFFWLFIKTPKQGAQAVLNAALNPELQNVTGKYLSEFKIVEEEEETDEVKNNKLAEWLWITSTKWTKL